MHVPVAVTDASSGERRDVSWLRSRKLYAFCALGNPRSFLKTLEKAGACVLGARLFRDHFAYTAREADELAREAAAAGADGAETAGAAQDEAEPEGVEADYEIVDDDKEKKAEEE